MKMHSRQELTEADLERIEGLIECASVGPWYSYVAGRDVDATSNYIELGWCNELGSFKRIEVAGASIDDQDFIASARQDMPRLLHEVRSLRARIEALRDLESGLRRRAAKSADGPAVHA